MSEYLSSYNQVTALSIKFDFTGRSATVVAAYLMKTLNISPEEAVEMIREQRPVV